jgi:hypothetical protein
MRKYEVRPKATVSVSDDGRVEVEVDLVNLPWEMEQDYLAGHPEPQVERDVETVREAFMASPFNHTMQTTLTK